MAKTVIGLFNTMEQGRDAAKDLEAAGFGKDQVSIIAKQEQAGGVAGAVARGGSELLSGLSTVSIPGMGTVLGTGPIASMRTGTGGLIGSLGEVGVPEEQARMYEENIRRGNTLIAVTTDDRSADRAAAILNRYEVVEAEQRVETSRAGTAATATSAAQAKPAPQPKPAAKPMARPAAPAQPAAATPPAQPPGRAAREAAQGQTIREPVVQEELIVGKHPIVRGGVRVFTHITERPVEERVTLRDETIHVERHPVDRPATEADITRPGDRDVVVREVDEEPVIGKRARVVEEVVISKDVQEREESVRDTVRRREVDVRPEGGAGSESFGRYESDFRTHYDRSFGRGGMPYEQYAPAYRYGGELASDQRFAGRDWKTVSSEARADWERRNPGSRWDTVEQAVRYAWEKVKGKA